MAKTVKDYLDGFPRSQRAVLARVRSAIRDALPGADEVISYGIPAFKQHGRIIVYFAGWQEHYSLYPLNKRMEAAFATELARHEISGRGTVRFSFEDAVPVRLIQRIAKFRAKEVAAAAAARRTTAKKR
jgi:uncharacterized protein YdhG (YjbR/CyaY superfamily)